MFVQLIGCGLAAVLLLAAAPALALGTGQCLSTAQMNAALKAEGQHSLIVGDRLDYDGQPITFMNWTMTRAEWRDLTRDLRSGGPHRRRIGEGLRAKGRSQAHVEEFFDKLLGVTAILEKGDPDAPMPRLMTAFVANADGSTGYVLEGDKPAAQTSTRMCIRAKLAGIRLPGRIAASGETELLSGSGNVMQLNGVPLSGLTMALRGNFANGKATFVATQPGKSPPLFYMAGTSLTAFAKSQMEN